jgi:peptide deformylase
MAILEILKYPEPGLSRLALPVENITGETMQLIGDMLETMYAAPGVGLAAPQVGVSQRVVVLDVNHENPRKGFLPSLCNTKSTTSMANSSSTVSAA